MKSHRILRKLQGIITEEEVTQLLNLSKGLSPIGLRDDAIIELLYATGMKTSELINLRIEDINLDKLFIRIKQTVFKKRIIPLNEWASKKLKKYLEEGRLKLIEKYVSDLVFISKFGRRLTKQVINRFLSNYARHAGIKKRVNALVLRHSLAVHLLHKGIKIQTIQKLLGHVDLSTTELYEDVSKPNATLVYLRFHPRA